MTKDNPVVRFICTSKPCRHEGNVELSTLVGDGCPTCGSKRLEVWHPHRGHVLIDYRSPVTNRKRRRRRERAALGAAIALVALFLGCTTAPTPPRPTPSVYWSLGDVSEVSGHVAEETPGRVRMFFLADWTSIEDLQIWRVEWSPAGDPCFYPLAYPMAHHGTEAVILRVQVTGTAPGDQVLLWRSHPWPGYDNTPAPELCLKPVLGGV